MGLIFLGGINGVGKTSIAQAIFKRCPSLRVIQGSGELMKQLNISVGDYRTLQKISERVKRQALEIIFCNLKSQSQAHEIIITGHYVKVLNGIIASDFGPWFQNCDKLVLVVSPPKQIINRVLIDEVNRKRMQRNLFGSKLSNIDDQIKLLEYAQRMSEKVMADIAQKFHLSSFRINNPDGKIELAINQLINLIQRG